MQRTIVRLLCHLSENHVFVHYITMNVHFTNNVYDIYIVAQTFYKAVFDSSHNSYAICVLHLYKVLAIFIFIGSNFPSIPSAAVKQLLQ